MRSGLVNRLSADRETLIASGLELAGAIAAKSPLAVAGAKMSLEYGRGRTVEDGLRHIAMWNASALATADLGEAITARLAGGNASFPDLDA